jgi:Sulfotransferase family
MGQPHFLCIGAQKAGTSWLYAMLAQHPGVFLPPVKEIHFFDFVHVPENRWWIRRMFAKTATRLARADPGLRGYFDGLAALPRRSDAWYRAVFDHPGAAGRVGGEITPAYSFLPEAGVRHVRAINPAMRLVFVIRDPVDRALSQLRMNAEKAARAEIGPEVLADPRAVAEIAARSAYRANIERWEAVFPPEQLLYLPYPGIAADPEGFLRAVEAFVGVPPHRYAAMRDSVHRSREVAIAPAVRDGLERRFATEREWLAGRFGAAFGF